MGIDGSEIKRRKDNQENKIENKQISFFGLSKNFIITCACIFLTVVVFTYTSDYWYSPKSSVRQKNIITKNNESISNPIKPVWTTYESKDRMTEKMKYFAFSPTISPIKKMDFPYGDIKSWIGVGCQDGYDWAYLGFNGTPNLNDDETKNGYNIITARIRWDQQIEGVELSQTWGSKVLNFNNDAAAISKIASAKLVLLELQWHGEGSVYFEYPLDGALEAIAQIRAKCTTPK